MRTGGVAVLFVAAAAAMAGLWRTPWVWPVLGALALLMLAWCRDRRAWAYFGLGAGLGGAVDLAQSAAGVTLYQVRDWLGLMPSFALIYWGMAGVVLYQGIKLVPARRGQWVDSALLLVAIALSLGANRAPAGVALAIALAWGLARRWDPVDLALGGLAAGAGPALEALLVASGLYHFPSASFWGVPGWLPVLYLALGASARGVIPALGGAGARIKSRRPGWDVVPVARWGARRARRAGGRR